MSASWIVSSKFRDKAQSLKSVQVEPELVQQTKYKFWQRHDRGESRGKDDFEGA